MMMPRDMEDLLFSNSALLAAAILLSLFLLLLSKPRRRREPIVPEAKGAWPFLGHLHLLAGPVPPHLVLSKMADRHGPIFAIRMGLHKALVVNSWEIARECLTTNDKVLATRPRSVASEVMAYDYAMFGLAPYGEHWRSVRRMVMTQVLSNRRLALLQHVRESEVRASIKGLYDQWKENNGQSVEMTKVFGNIVLNIIFRMIVGKRYEDEKDEQARKALRVFFEIVGKFLLSDALPYLRWLDIGGHEKEMRDTARKLDRAVQGWLDEHRSRRKLEGKRKGEDEDFMDVMISTIDEGRGEQFTDYDADTVIKSTCMSLVLAASDTSMVTMTWALSLLLDNEAALKRAQQELDEVIGKGRHVTEDDLNNLPYIQAIVKETLRLYPAGPLSVPHQSMEDCTIHGYHVEKGTRVIFNLTKIHRDARVWEDPEEFKPERFLRDDHKDLDGRGTNFEYIPFGGGRRICPGISMAFRVVGLSLASFLHGFEFTMPGNEPVDMTEAIGLTNLKATPLRVMVKPRLTENLYDV